MWSSCPFPSPTGGRPGAGRHLIVSSARFNDAHGQAILAMVTSTAGEWPSDVAVRGWREAGLNVPCKVRLKFFTLDRTLIVRRLGALSQRDGAAVKGALRRFLTMD